MFQIKLEFFGYSAIVFGVFWVTSEKFLSKSGNYFSQIIELLFPNLRHLSKDLKVHTAHTHCKVQTTFLQSTSY
jgi:hypothetical protein